MARGSGEAVLVVDADNGIRRMFVAALDAAGYRPLVAVTAQEGLSSAATEDPSVIVVDLDLPDLPGEEVCRRIRAYSVVPILVLSGDHRERRKVDLLELGADDYITKPYSTPELLARVGVAVRRFRQLQTTLAPGADDAVLAVGSLTIDVSRHRAELNGRRLALTPKEFGILTLLARFPGRVLTHQQILHEVWGNGYDHELHYTRVYTSQIRKKLGVEPGAPRLVSEAGVGYSLVGPSDDD